MSVHEPRVERLIQFTIYVVVIGGGLSAWVDAPSAVAWTIGAPLTFAWGALMVLGGLLGASSVLRGSWWVERSAIAFAAGGIAIYASAGFFIQASGVGPARGPSIAVTVIALLSLAGRWRRIRRYAYDPEG